MDPSTVNGDGHVWVGPPDRPPSAPRRHSTRPEDLLVDSLNRLTIDTAASIPLPQSPSLQPTFPPTSLPSPALKSPRPLLDRLPSSPSLRRSSSTLSNHYPTSPALKKKTSTSSLRDFPHSPLSSNSRRLSTNPVQMSPRTRNSGAKSMMDTTNVATDYFKKDLELNHADSIPCSANTAVILHDQCYGHRYERTPYIDVPEPGRRKRSAKEAATSDLAQIVERPERLLATTLGIATAYVQLGGRHCGGDHAPGPNSNLPHQVPFVIRKSTRMELLTSDVVTAIHGVEWMNEMNALASNVTKEKLSEEWYPTDPAPELARRNSSGELIPNDDQLAPFDMYMGTESIKAIQGAIGGVLDGVDAVFQKDSTGSGPSRAFVAVRPPGHHCTANWPSGFCWVNNVHIGIEHAVRNYGLTHAAIIDIDLHHGDGSQDIAMQRNYQLHLEQTNKKLPGTTQPSIGYFSLHDPRSFPCEHGEIEKIKGASVCVEDVCEQTIWNAHLEAWDETTESEEKFWTNYEQKYSIILEKARAHLKRQTDRFKTGKGNRKPKAAIFISTGFDAHEFEMSTMQRHKAKVPQSFYARVTKDIVRLSEEEGTSVEGRVISVMEGGYNDRALTSGVISHLGGLCNAEITHTAPDGSPKLALRMDNLGLSTPPKGTTTPEECSEPSGLKYDCKWADKAYMEELENPTVELAPQRARKGRKSMATFDAHTKASEAKVVDPSKIVRTSGRFTPAPESRPGTPEAVNVPWTAASKALCQLLIPTDRQTKSATVEDIIRRKVAPLPARAQQKAKKPAKGADEAAAPAPATRGGLRSRKTVTPPEVTKEDFEPTLKPATAAEPKSRANRRRTMAALPTHDDAPKPRPASSRRVSMASSIGSRRTETPAPPVPAPVEEKKSLMVSLPLPKLPQFQFESPKPKIQNGTEAISKANEVTEPVPTAGKATESQTNTDGVQTKAKSVPKSIKATAPKPETENGAKPVPKSTKATGPQPKPNLTWKNREAEKAKAIEKGESMTSKATIKPAATKPVKPAASRKTTPPKPTANKTAAASTGIKKAPRPSKRTKSPTLPPSGLVTPELTPVPEMLSQLPMANVVGVTENGIRAPDTPPPPPPTIRPQVLPVFYADGVIPFAAKAENKDGDVHMEGGDQE